MDKELDLTSKWYVEHLGVRHEFDSIKDAIEGAYKLGYSEGISASAKSIIKSS